MNNEQALSVAQGQLSTAQSNLNINQQKVDAWTLAVKIFTDGYQSDAAAIAAAVATQVGDIQTENTTLTTELATANGTITSMTAILAGLGYNPDGTPITPSE